LVRPRLSPRWFPADPGGACGTLVEALERSMAAPKNIQRPTEQAASERDEIERRLDALSQVRRRLEAVLRDVHPRGKQRTG
jgi:hypothetical protein